MGLGYDDKFEQMKGEAEMYLNDYQHKAVDFAVYEDELYPIVSLGVEAAELADIFIKPWLRGDDVVIKREKLVSEAGDVLWNLAVLLSDQGITLDEVARTNIVKLTSRKERNVIKGSGDR